MKQRMRQEPLFVDSDARAQRRYFWAIDAV